jgi:hypothetical protein
MWVQQNGKAALRQKAQAEADPAAWFPRTFMVQTRLPDSSSTLPGSAASHGSLGSALLTRCATRMCLLFQRRFSTERFMPRTGADNYEGRPH